MASRHHDESSDKILNQSIQAPEGSAAKERRSSVRYACTRLVVVRLPDAMGEWRWYWVTDVSAGGLAVSFFVRADQTDPIESTLLDVDRGLSYPVRLRLVWHRPDAPTPRTGFAFAEPSRGLLQWVRRIGGESDQQAVSEEESLWSIGDTKKGPESRSLK